MVWISGCGSSENGSSSNRESTYSPPENQFTVPGQINASDRAFSIQLHPKESQQSAPILELGSSDQLVLSFDLLEFENRQLTIKFTHHDPDWSRSGLAEDFYKDGFYSLRLPTGDLSRTNRPNYRTYEYEFPNDDVELLASGNYMLQVEDADNGNFLFSMPFFVFENEGSIRSQVETITVPRREGRISHLPRSVYELPDFIDTPQFDLEYYYVQNQFWGRARQPDELDTSTQGEVMFELTRDRAFVGDYEFQFLSLTDFSMQAPGIRDYAPAEIPPRIVLFDDVQGFSANRSDVPGSRLGAPDPSGDARYANVHFRFDARSQINPENDLYVVGDFNNWAIRSNYRMEYRQDTERWHANGIIKSGTYAYKYVEVGENEIKDLTMDDSFTRNAQEYHAFVYFQDPNRFYYRLLQINNFFENS
ncbi:MAG: type IX secretion system plug protein domain-containing protein [Bacteroidota bacterium]